MLCFDSFFDVLEVSRVIHPINTPNLVCTKSVVTWLETLCKHRKNSFEVWETFVTSVDVEWWAGATCLV